MHGATGAIGSAAVQLVRSLGAKVTAVCDTDNLELVRGLGADKVIDYTVDDFTKDEQKHDVVLDSVGKSSSRERSSRSSTEYRLDQIVEAYRYVETGQKVGNVVISLEHSH